MLNKIIAWSLAHRPIVMALMVMVLVETKELQGHAIACPITRLLMM